MKHKLYLLAEGFRHALSTCPKDQFSSFQKRHLENFPEQSCDVASLLLAYYLRDRGVPNVERVFGFWKTYTHAWLEIRGWIVDITADQFSGIDPIIAVSAKSQSWHSNFFVQIREPAYPPETSTG